MLRLDQTQKPIQVQKITPNLVLTQKVLQLTALQIEKEIYQELQNNPALELSEETICQQCGLNIQSCNCENKNIENIEAITNRLLQLASNNYQYETSNEEDDYNEHNILKYEKTFQECLIEELKFLKLKEEHYKAGEYIISLIDENGFLNLNSLDYEEISNKFEISPEEINNIIRKIQSLEPIGIGVQSPKEALLKQLEELELSGKVNSISKTILKYYWDDFLKEDIKKLSKKLKAKTEEVKKAINFIKNNLSPYPINVLNFRNFKLHNLNTVKPDVIFTIRDGKVCSDFTDEVRLNVKINPLYLELYEKIKHNNSNLKKEEKQHIKECILRAKAFINCIQTRKNILNGIFNTIAKHQADFIKYGFSKLKPLRRKDIARELSISESTVSRALSNRYFSLPSGEIMSFDSLFDSSLYAKEFIKKIIANEDKKKPFSDESITKIMNQNGFKLARRTITKYREELKILPANLRKEK